MEQSRTKLFWLQTKISNAYYKYGFFCATNPKTVILFALLVLSVCCYPLIHFQFFESSPSIIFAFQHFPPTAYLSNSPWEKPIAYIQQVILKTSVDPWPEEFQLQDAFRGPLSQVFSLEETIQNHQFISQENKAISLSDVCHQVSEPLEMDSFLPHYSCLILSPGLLWNKDFNSFQQDQDIIKTIFRHPKLKLDTANFREIIFGVPWKETGIKRFNMRARPRVLTFAVTMVLSSYNPDYIKSLQQDLLNRFPYPSEHFILNETKQLPEESLSSVHFSQSSSPTEMVALIIAYVFMFLYIYFSVKKIEMVKSKWLLAFSALITVVSSLLMSLGLCLWFGLVPTLSSGYVKEALPYLVIVVGLENMLVMTKSVVSTPIQLDLKVRVAQGLSKEGWSITKHLFMELMLLAFSFFTFVPAIQEFCLVASVMVLSDFFLQLVFFITVLSTDLTRAELSDFYKGDFSNHADETKHDHSPQPYSPPVLQRSRNGFSRKLSWVPITSQGQASNPPMLVKLPKRLRLVYFWARTRMMQRFLMVFFLGWIIWFIYISGVIDSLTLGKSISPMLTNQVLNPLLKMAIFNQTLDPNLPVESLLQHSDTELWRQLPSQHWSSLFGFYNISVAGNYVRIVPPILLSSVIAPDFIKPLSLKPETQPSDLDLEDTLSEPPHITPDVYLTVAVGLPIVLIVIYFMIFLYRCMCSRHYAEWRTSWRQTMPGIRHHSVCPDSYFMVEALPIKYPGHAPEIETLVATPNLTVSSCLSGDILVWDTRSGECLNYFVRSKVDGPTSQQEVTPTVYSHRRNDSNSSDIVSMATTSTKPITIPRNSCDHFPTDYQISPQSADLGYDFSTYYPSPESCSSSPGSTDYPILATDSCDMRSLIEETRIHKSTLNYQPVWCMDCEESLLVLGCSEGRIEVWNAYTGAYVCSHSENSVGITAIKLNGKRVILARLDGSLEFYVLEFLVMGEEGEAKLVWFHTLRSHNQPIMQLAVAYGHVITASHDHLIKVYKYETLVCIFTFHGHIGGITALHIDQGNLLASGCQGGLVCLWDLMTGTCAYTVQGHQARVRTLLITPMYLLSGGADNRICIWEKCHGHLLHTIVKEQSFCDDFVLLTPNIMITAKENHLMLWDVNHGEALQMIALKRGEQDRSIRKLQICGQSLVCDFGNQLYIIHFPRVSDKAD